MGTALNLRYQKRFSYDVRILGLRDPRIYWNKIEV